MKETRGRKGSTYLYQGQYLTMKEISDRCGISVQTLASRIIRANWTMEKATTVLPRKWGKREKVIKKPQTTSSLFRAKYCMQDGECDNYSKCGGLGFEYPCFTKEIQASGMQSISSECRIIL